MLLEQSGMQKDDELIRLKTTISSLQLSLEEEYKRFSTVKSRSDNLQKEFDLVAKTLINKEDTIKQNEGLLDMFTREQTSYLAQMENFRAAIDQGEKDLKLADNKNNTLVTRVQKIVEFASTLKTNTICLANFSSGSQVLLLLNEANIYEIFQKPKGDIKYFLAPQYQQGTTSPFLDEIRRKAPIIGKIWYCDELKKAEPNNPFKLSKGEPYMTVHVGL